MNPEAAYAAAFFVDDDETELDHFRKIVGGIYDYNTVRRPNESKKLSTVRHRIFS
jgi:hypothetical protein